MRTTDRRRRRDDLKHIVPLDHGANPGHKHNVYLSVDQLDALADEAGRYRSLVLLLGVGGLRWFGAAALRVGDVDFLRRRISLHRNAVRMGSQSVLGPLKTNENRVVVLPGFVIEALAVTAGGKVVTIWSGPRPRADTLDHRRRCGRGSPVRCTAVSRPTRRSRPLRPTT